MFDDLFGDIYKDIEKTGQPEEQSATTETDWDTGSEQQFWTTPTPEGLWHV